VSDAGLKPKKKMTFLVNVPIVKNEVPRPLDPDAIRRDPVVSYARAL
jgi:hypothetical protein